MTLSIIAVIILCSFFQSIFGVGILIFGTPTLLLMGFSFQETLYLILPSSILVSLFQALSLSKFIQGKRYVHLYTLPSVFLGLFAMILAEDDLNIRHIVGSMLLLIGLNRSLPFVEKKIKIFLSKNKAIYHVIMGLIHGVSNMGGGMLVLLMSSIHLKKEIVLANIAYTYLLFGIIQLATLFVFSRESLQIEALFLALISIVVYIFSSKFIVKNLTDTKFNFFITFLIISYGILSFTNIG